jgi:hypothetical protein
MDLMEIGIDGENWIQLAQDRVHWRAFVNTVMNLWVPQRKQAQWLSFSKNILHHEVSKWSTGTRVLDVKQR